MTARRLLALPLVWLVRLYQLLISPMISPSCRFYPSCSAYAVTALTRFGPIRGTWLTVCRLARCHPWNPGGVDHVPARGSDGRPVPEPSTESEDVLGSTASNESAADGRPGTSGAEGRAGPPGSDGPADPPRADGRGHPPELREDGRRRAGLSEVAVR